MKEFTKTLPRYRTHIKRVLQLDSAGKHYHEIANDIGSSVRTVARWISRWEKENPEAYAKRVEKTASKKAALKARALKLLASGMTQVEVAKRCKISQPTVSNWHVESAQAN